MAKAVAISNEQIISAILSNSTISEAAAVCGLSVRAIYDRMDTREFKSEYTAAKGDILRAAVNKLNTQLTAAVDVIAEIMRNTEVNPATRLQAAQTILNNAAKFSERLDSNERNTLYQKSSECAILDDLFKA